MTNGGAVAQALTGPRAALQVECFKAEKSNLLMDAHFRTCLKRLEDVTICVEGCAFLQSRCSSRARQRPQAVSSPHQEGIFQTHFKKKTSFLTPVQECHPVVCDQAQMLSCLTHPSHKCQSNCFCRVFLASDRVTGRMIQSGILEPGLSFTVKQVREIVGLVYTLGALPR